jgi:uncharacterized protein
LERRNLPIEFRKEDERIIGHAAVFDTPATIGGFFDEVVRKGAFEESIQNDDIRALWNHDPNYVLGRNKSGTLRLTEDQEGLSIENDPPETQWAKDLMVSMKRGDIDQMSFGFRVIQERWTTREGQPDLRELLKVRLYDVSPVTYPAYEETDVQVRTALENAPDDIRSKLLSDGGQGAPEDEDKPKQGPRLRLKKLNII